MKSIINKIILTSERLTSNLNNIESKLQNNLSLSEYEEISAALDNFYNTYFITTRRLYSDMLHYLAGHIILNNKEYRVYGGTCDNYNGITYWQKIFTQNLGYPGSEYLEIDNNLINLCLNPRNAEKFCGDDFLIAYYLTIWKCPLSSVYEQQNNQFQNVYDIIFMQKQLLVRDQLYYSIQSPSLLRDIKLPAISAQQCYIIDLYYDILFGYEENWHNYKIISNVQTENLVLNRCLLYWTQNSYIITDDDGLNCLIISWYNNEYKLTIVTEQLYQNYWQEIDALIYQENYDILQYLPSISIQPFNTESYMYGYNDEQTDQYHYPYYYQPFIGQYTYTDHNGIIHNITIEKLTAKTSYPEEYRKSIC